jgi:protein DGCR14
MFAPDADVSPYVSTKSSKLPADPKSIKHGNTRLPGQDDQKDVNEPPSPTRSHIDAAIAGTQCEFFQTFTLSDYDDIQ